MEIEISQKWKTTTKKSAENSVSFTNDDQMVEIGKSWISCFKEMINVL